MRVPVIVAAFLFFALLGPLGRSEAGSQGPSRLVFATGGDGASWRREIAAINADGTGFRKLTHVDPAPGFDPCWTRDGRWIVYSSQDAVSSGRSITAWRVRAAGGDVGGMPTPGHEAFWAVPSPNGRLVAMISYSLPRNYVDDRVVDLRGRTVAKLRLGGFGSDFYRPLWSPDGRSLAVTEVVDTGTSYFQWVEVVPANGRSPGRRVTPKREGAGALSWSPDGRRLLIEVSGRKSVWYTIRLDGSDRRRLFTLPLARGSDIDAWSPDSGTVAYVSGGGILGISALGGPSRRLVRVRSRGKQLASVSVDWSSRGELAFSDVGGIYTARPEGTALRRVTTKRGAPSWSSDGRRLAFAHDGEIFVVGRRGGGLRQLTRWRVDSEPRLSPDGSRIVFTRGSGSYTASRPESVYLIGGPGGGRRLVGAGSDARWSPDGRRLAYVDHVRVESKRSPAIDRVVVFDVDSRTRTSVATGTSSAWSPDGERIAFMRYTFSRTTHGWEIGSSSLLTMRADGSDVHELTSASGETRLFAPAWSPDGKTIVVSGDTDYGGFAEFVDPTSGATRRLDVDVGSALVWSPGGNELAFHTYASIGILDVETGKARRLLQSDKLAYRDVVWSPDGRQVGFIRCASPEPEDCDVYAMNADGTDQRRLTRTRGLEYGLDWGSAG